MMYFPAAVFFIVITLTVLTVQLTDALSVCMTDYCKSAGPGGPHTPSLYHQYCCNTSNSGKTIKLRETKIVKIIHCPPFLHSSCPRINDSCSAILQYFPGSKSGDYNIILSNGSVATVYCDMEGSRCDGNGGWMRVGYVNMTQSGATCPQGLYTYQFDSVTLCDRVHPEPYAYPSPGCSSTSFSTSGFNYTQVCGQVRGYQFRAPDGIYSNNEGSSSIDEPYVDGVSITHGRNIRHHIWTYAAGLTDGNTDDNGCPCNTGTTQTTPSYVGSDYYCESGLQAGSNFENMLYFTDPLWDGQQCLNIESTCCTSSRMPWFIKTLTQSTTDDIELRLCSSE